MKPAPHPSSAGVGAVGAIRRIDGRIGRLPLHGVAATRRIEAVALATRPAFALMERAGDATARLALALAPHAQRIAVYAGPGNNGGDGLVAAARLTQMGKRVSVVLVADPAHLVVDAARALAVATAAQVEIVPFADASEERRTAPCDLVVDALLGIGASRSPQGELAAAIAGIAGHSARGVCVLAVDVPSGLDADRGVPIDCDDRREPTCAVRADDTLTMISLKPGLFTAQGRDFAGTVWLASLEIDLDGDDGAPDAWLLGESDPSAAPKPRLHADHKGRFGDVAVVGGAPGMTGAAWLAACAAHAAGAGRVFVDLLAASSLDSDDGAASLRSSAIACLEPARPELMVRAGWSAGAANVLGAATVVCGCGGGDAVRPVLPRLLSTVPRLVVDADALNAVASDASLASLLRARAARGLSTVLTPHPLEAARLLGTTTDAVQSDRIGAAVDLAARFSSVVVLKGSGTIVASPGEVPRVCATGNASLASAGTGDVLAGWIGGRWSATRATAFDAATRGVVEHGAAADPERPGALRALDLVEELYRRSRRC